MTKTALFGALHEALVTMLAAIVTLLCVLAVAPGPGSTVLSVVLCLSLSRSQLDRDWRHRLEAAVALPVVGVAAIVVGILLQRWPWFGAAVFVAAMFLSIWLRKFGANAQRVGSLIALPLVTLLVTPHIEANPVGPVPALLVPVLIALLALFWVSVFHAVARYAGFLPPQPIQPASRSAPARENVPRIAASTRMAIQMALALALSFAIGYLFFGHRWAWIVLTAFIVNSDNRGRLDVAYKSVLRVAGAAAGTIFALLFRQHIGAHDFSNGALILTALFIGVWLRPLGYAWWALFVTIALALLQGFNDEPASGILWLRLEEIVIGALIGVAAAWWILPLRSTDVLRRRIADALGALSAALDPAIPERTPDAFIHAMAGMEKLAPAFRASRLARRRMQQADWIDVLNVSRDAAIALIERGDTPTEVRRAVGAARKALREPSTLLQALLELQSLLILEASKPKLVPD
jgi:fusaric acid resistance family protein